MSEFKTKLLTTLHFEGPRFEDHGLDLDVLPELVAYKKLVLETAKELWRSRNPDRERIPRNFDTLLSLKMFSLEEGSVAIPLKRVVQEKGIQTELDLGDEFDNAALLLEEAIGTMSADEGLPDDFPANVVPLFKDFGVTLKEEESIAAHAPGRDQTVRYTQQVRERFIKWQDRRYEDRIDLSGEVRKADLDGRTFSIRQDDGKKVEGKFDSEQEQQVIDALHDHAQTRLRLTGTGEFDRQSRDLVKIVRVDEIRLVAMEGPAYDEEARPIWEIVSEISAKIPDEEWAKVPEDLSVNLDHYLHGVPKERS